MITFVAFLIACFVGGLFLWNKKRSLQVGFVLFLSTALVIAIYFLNWI